MSCAKTDDLPFGLWTWVGPRKHVQSYLLGGANVPDNTLPWAVQKRLNRSICCLGCRLGWAKGSTSSIVFARCHQLMFPYGWAHWRHLANTTKPSVGCGDAALCQITLTTCYWSLPYFFAICCQQPLECAAKTTIQEQYRKMIQHINKMRVSRYGLKIWI